MEVLEQRLLVLIKPVFNSELVVSPVLKLSELELIFLKIALLIVLVFATRLVLETRPLTYNVEVVIPVLKLSVLELTFVKIESQFSFSIIVRRSLVRVCNGERERES